MSDIPDLYSILGVDAHATGSDITRAYRVLLRRHHPDTRPSPAPEEAVHRHQARLQQAMDAHAVLSDPTRRARYDHSHQQRPNLGRYLEPPRALFLPASMPGPEPSRGYFLEVSPLWWDPSPRAGGASK
ncbi:MAG: J domain-containing protein [Paeniglutamicibacter terrestris]